MPEPTATWNPARGVWETARVNLLCGHSELYSATWPSSGMTRRGMAYALPTSAPHTGGSESSSSPGLLPTPTASDRFGAGAHGDGGMDLRTTVSLMPTPRATDGTKGGPNQRGSSGDLMLPSAVQLLPTPDANMGNGGRVRSAEALARGDHQLNLNDLPRLLPTPTCADANGSGGSTPSDATLTDAVVRTSLGATTNPRFAAGKPSPDGAHPTPPRQGELDLD